MYLILKLVCSRIRIPEQIFFNSSNIKFDSWITHLGYDKRITGQLQVGLLIVVFLLFSLAFLSVPHQACVDRLLFHFQMLIVQGKHREIQKVVLDLIFFLPEI